MKTSTRSGLLVASSAIVAFGVIPSICAASADATADQGAKLEEIVVTAQKRTEDLQAVPISAQVVSSQTLAEQNYNSLQQLTELTPAVHIADNNFSNDLYIRGVGSGRNQALDQSVATFSDDIYHGRSRMSDVTFLDLNRIEVLKGPQSTFFGNNAIAGALNIITAKPGDSFEAWGRGLYGMFGQYAVEGAVSGPITDTLGARLAVTRNGDDRGWIDNVNLSEEVPRVNNLAGRLTLDFHPVEDLDAVFKVEGSRNRTSGSSNPPAQWVNCPPPKPYTPGFMAYGSCVEALSLGIPIGINDNLTTGLPGQDVTLSTFEDVLTINYRQWGQNFTSVSGFYNYHFDTNEDAGLLPFNLVGTVQFPEKYHQFSQEFRMASATDQPIEYMVGGYFQTDDLSASFVGNAPLLDFLGGLVPALEPYLPIAAAEPFSQDEHVYSVFGSGRWNVSDDFKINAGIRGSWENKSVTGSRFWGTGAALYGDFVEPPPAIESLLDTILQTTSGTQSLRESDHAWMPSAGLQYQIAPRVMTYFTYSRGFKAGGINGEDSLNTPQNITYKPEYVNAYEVGLKSKWLDETVLMDVDVFRSNYRDLQVQAGVYNPATEITSFEIRNAARSVSQGVELEGQWLVTRDFRLSTNFTYLESYYVSYPNAPQNTFEQFCAAPNTMPACAVFPGGQAPGAFNAGGQTTPYAPRWSGSVVASESIHLPAGLKLTTALMPYATSAFTTGTPADQFNRIGGYVRLDARVSLEPQGGRWAVDLIGKNLTDRIILSSVSFYQASKEQPRNVALQARFKW